MNDREMFESAFPIPSGVKWENDALGVYFFSHDGEYQAIRATTHRNQRRNQLRANSHNLALKVWRHRNDEIRELEYKIKVMSNG